MTQTRFNQATRGNSPGLGLTVIKRGDVYVGALDGGTTTGHMNYTQMVGWLASVCCIARAEIDHLPQPV